MVSEVWRIGKSRQPSSGPVAHPLSDLSGDGAGGQAMSHCTSCGDEGCPCFIAGVEAAQAQIKEHSCDDFECNGCTICYHATEWGDDLESLLLPSKPPTCERCYDRGYWVDLLDGRKYPCPQCNGKGTV